MKLRTVIRKHCVYLESVLCCSCNFFFLFHLLHFFTEIEVGILIKLVISYSVVHKFPIAIYVYLRTYVHSKNDVWKRRIWQLVLRWWRKFLVSEIIKSSKLVIMNVVRIVQSRTCIIKKMKSRSLTATTNIAAEKETNTESLKATSLYSYTGSCVCMRGNYKRRNFCVTNSYKK